MIGKLREKRLFRRGRQKPGNGRPNEHVKSDNERNKNEQPRSKGRGVNPNFFNSHAERS